MGPSDVFKMIWNRFPHEELFTCLTAADEAVSQFVIPAKPRKTGREARSRIVWIHSIFWIPDLTAFVRNDISEITTQPRMPGT